MIVCIGPSIKHADETFTSLKFAERAKKVQNKPSKNLKIDYRVLAMQLQEEIDARNDSKTNLELKIENLEKLLNEEKQKNIRLEEKIAQFEREMMDGVSQQMAIELEKKFTQSSDEISALKKQLEGFRKTCLILKENNEQIHEKLELTKTEKEGLVSNLNEIR